LLATLSTIAASVVAIFGVVQWRFQKIGERKIELAEEMLALFYEAKDVIAFVRGAMSTADESADRPHGENEDQNTANQRDSFYAPIARLRNKQEFFSRLQSLKYRAMATFGRESSRPFMEIIRIRAEILTAAQMLYRSVPDQHNAFALPALGNEMSETLGNKIWDISTDLADDELAARITAAVSEIEGVCSPVIQEWAHFKISKIFGPSSRSRAN
jgi:hypothetical protein